MIRVVSPLRVLAPVGRRLPSSPHLTFKDLDSAVAWIKERCTIATEYSKRSPTVRLNKFFVWKTIPRS